MLSSLIWLGLLVPYVSCGVGGVGGSSSVLLDYKIYVYGGTRDCYYQYAYANSNFYVSYQVVRGGDLKVGFHARYPNGTELQPYAWQESAEIETYAADPGYYEICFDNSKSRIGYRLVGMHMASFRYEDWTEIVEEIESFHLTAVNFTSVLSGVINNTQSMLHHLQGSRDSESRDYGLLEDNLWSIDLWSFLHCLMIATSSVMQIVFVRAIFKWYSK